MANNKTSSWWLPLILAGVSLVLSAFTSYNRNDKDLTNRVAVLEAHQEDATPRLNRIETKLDQVDDKIDEVARTILTALNTKAK